MHPVLIWFGQFPLHSYGVLIALGFLCAVFLVKYDAMKLGWPVATSVDWCFLVLLVGFLGARALFILTRFEDFSTHPEQIFYVWEGGLVFYGGPLLALPWTIWFLRRHRIPFFEFADSAVQGLTLAHAFGRLGCLMAGCCFGKPTTHWWGIPLDSELVPEKWRGIPLHPTQLYEALSLLILFIALRFFVARRRKFKGQVMLSYFCFYPIIRSIIEIFRGDLIRGFVISDVVSTSQFISIFVFLASLGAMKVIREKR